MQKLIFLPKEKLTRELWLAAPQVKRILIKSNSLQEARDRIFNYLNHLEGYYFSVFSDKRFRQIHILEKNNAKECIRVLKNTIRTENEHLTRASALRLLFNIANNKKDALSKVTNGFLCEFLFLFRGAHGNSGLLSAVYEFRSFKDDRHDALLRSLTLDKYSEKMQEYIWRKYITGLDPDIVEKRKLLKKHILENFKANDSDWTDYRWHLQHIIKDTKTLASIVKLEKDEVIGLNYAKKHNIPFHITPYYLSLFNKSGRNMHDRSVRAQVLPSLNYCSNVVQNLRSGKDLDFMGEKSTSPIDCITRRYPQILILKPYDSCPQICVYCQRNWELKSIDDAKIKDQKIKKAIKWISKNKNITEVLITGGDPFMLNNDYLSSLLGQLARLKHIERIRIGTRILVTLPFRIDDGLLNILKKYHKWGTREVCIVTHFEYPSEITPESLDAVEKIKNIGINIYNQEVFTYFNSRKYLSCLLRKKLKLIGVDPYYTFNTKGKEETIDFRVPISRIEQERKEEARLLPGIVRTDEPVFNVPRLGKNHLRGWQGHEPIMILADGRRVYRFYPWDSKLKISDDYIYTDVSIYDYLKRLHKDGDNLNDYRSIWYYF